MSNPNKQRRAAQLQTPATGGDMTPAERLAAGFGGSYSVDPATKEVSLTHATEGERVRREQDELTHPPKAAKPADQAGDQATDNQPA